MKSNKFWLILLAVLVIVSSIAALMLRQTPTSYARIYLHGELAETVNLLEVTEPYSMIFQTNGNLNIVELEYGRVRILESNCPSGACVRQGWISGGLIPIVCLPHRLVITLEGDDTNADIDAVVG